MIHRAPFGSIERFVAVLLEHCGGNFPLWLAPEQFAVLPISEKYNAYAEQVKESLEMQDIRGYVDARDEKIGRKIRDAEVSKVPYMIIVGEKEQELETISVRRHGQGDLGSLPIPAFVENFRAMVAEAMGG
jgi:threonyl-tRNA synthetase